MRYFCEKEVLVFAPKGDIKTNDCHVELYLHSMQIYNSGTISINHQNTSRKVINLQIGDLIEIEDYKFIINENNTLEFIDHEIESPALIGIENLIQAYPEYPEYTNSPRVKYDIADEKVDLERIPEKNKDTSKANLMKKLIPALVGIIVAVLMLWVRPRGIRGILMIITTFVSFAISLINLYSDRRDNRIHNENRHNIYSKYLDEKREELANLKLTELANFNHNFLSTNEMISEINNCTYRLYERDIKDEDFLKLRLGTYTAEPTYQLNNPFEKLELRYEDADEQLRELYDEYIQIKHVPLLCDIKNNTGLVGNRYVISEQLKNILMQLIFSHSYLDLKIIVITNEDFIEDYNYAFKMKHFSDHENIQKIFITNAKERDQFLSNYTQALRSRKQAYKPGMLFSEHYLFIIDNPALVNNHPIMEFFESDERSLMFSIIQIAKTRNELPKYIRTVIDYRTYEEAVLELENQKVRNLEIELPKIDKTTEELEAIYLQLCNLEHIKGIKSSIPDQLGFLEMYNVESPKELNINQRWQENHAYKSLAALMGKKSETDYLYMDLHEKVHGPHGLVAGTTGSGKSEVIQTYILSLALNFSPEQVGFLLIDYKGGGMANLFKDMPHHLGSITNLDGYQSMRALMSIKSELKRRQKIFADVNVNHINNYQKLFEQNKVEEALPHLFLISDEFAELKAEQPDFMKELVSAARIGRSLGIHLILATQKPDGVVDDQIWSNSKFKLSLKVAEEADSKALLKTSDAAYITNPGRGYLKVGNNELYELFQSGYSGAELNVGTTKKINQEIYRVDEHGIRELLNPEDCIEESTENEETITELDAVLNEITDVYNQNKLTPIKKPWLAPLSNYIFVPNDSLIMSKVLKTAIPLGIVDLPNSQSQKEYILDLVEEGTFGIFGSQGMGKTYSLLNIALKLAYINDPMNIKYFIFDFGSNGLIHLKDLKHTSEYMSDDDSSKMIQWKEYILVEMKKRKEKFANQKVSSFRMYNSVVKTPLQAIVIFIDDYAGIEIIDEDIRDVIRKVLSEGLNLGIYTVLSAGASSDMKANTLSDIKNRVLLNPQEKQEISTILARTEYPMQEKAGRAFVIIDEVEIMQLYAPIVQKNDQEQVPEITNSIKEINKMYANSNDEFKTMPAIIPYENKKVEDKLYIGKVFSTITDGVIPLTSITIGGMNKSGKTNFLKLIIEQLKNENEITILDDTAYSLLEYSETKGIEYLTDPEMIDFNSKIVIINKISRIEKLKNKQLMELLQRLFLMHLNGTIFITEEPANGLGSKKEDFYTMLKTTSYYMYFGLPTDQNRYPVNKNKYKKEQFVVSEYYLMSERGINKVKLPKVVTENENKEFVIPELKNLSKVSSLEVLNIAVLGRNYIDYVNKLIESNKETLFYVLDPRKEILKLDNIVHVNLDEIEKLEENSVLINNAFSEINKLDVKSRRALQDKFNNVILNKIITCYSEETKFKTECMQKYKKEKLFVFTENINSENIQKSFKITNRKIQEMSLNEGEAIQLIGKEIKKIKIN